MKTFTRSIVLAFLFFQVVNYGHYLLGQTSTKNEDVEKQFQELASQYLPGAKPISLQYKSESNSFGHLSRPWQTRSSKQYGRISLGKKGLLLFDTSERAGKETESVTRYWDDRFFKSRNDKPVDATASDRDEFLRLSCRYTPALLFRHVAETLSDHDGSEIKSSKNVEHSSFSGSLGNETFEIRFASQDAKLETITWRRHHETWGDQAIVFSYTGQNKLGNFVYPVSIKERSFDTTTFQVEIVSADQDAIPDLVVPEAYALTPEVKKEEKIVVEKFSDNVWFIELVHTESRTTLVEFKDFLMVIDAPISSHNGQLIVDRIEEMKLEKPIKYFTFGHHHPHYLGGLRPFIAKGATVLTTEKIVSYVKQLASFEHSIRPDALHQQKSELKLRTFVDKTTVTDGSYSIDIYDMGMKSKHTIDYLLCYFPKEKMLLQGDGIWIRSDQLVRDRTLAVYEAIKELGLDVEDCIQGWPTRGFGVATKIKFSELESAVNYSPDKATFEKLKALVGKWKRNDEKKLELIEYRMTARDSVLVEKWSWPDKGSEALTMYHMDGDRLIATHYCPSGNQPRLNFDSDSSGRKFVFNFDSATNLQDRSQSHCVQFWLNQTGKDSLSRSETYSSSEGVDVSKAEYLRVLEK